MAAPDYVYKGPSPLDRKLTGPKQGTDQLPRRSEDMRGDKLSAKDGSPSPDCIAPVVGENPTGPVKPKFDKVAYQREYMRKRRAAAKGEDR